MICQQCGQPVMLNPGSEHMPPWCQRCGADIRDALYGGHAAAVMPSATPHSSSNVLEKRPARRPDPKATPSPSKTDAPAPADYTGATLFVGVALFTAAAVLAVWKFLS